MIVVYTDLGKISVARTAVLKHVLRSMHRMMQSSGTAEGLRGLLDSSLLKSAKKIMQNRSVFGPAILPIGKLRTFHSTFLSRLTLSTSGQHHGDFCPQ